jgi:hypothetical protein
MRGIFMTRDCWFLKKGSGPLTERFCSFHIWVITLSTWVIVYQRFEGTYRLHLLDSLTLEDECGTFLRNVVNQ